MVTAVSGTLFDSTAALQIAGGWSSDGYTKDHRRTTTDLIGPLICIPLTAWVSDKLYELGFRHRHALTSTDLVSPLALM